MDSIIDTVSGGVRGVGKSVVGAMDKPMEAVRGPEGVHRVVDAFLDKFSDAMTRAIKDAGESAMAALDRPPKVVREVRAPELPRPPELR